MEAAAKPGTRTADGVFSGGGVKGIAFAGALTAASEAGWGDWHELAGTSAGAITAMALAAGYDAETLTAALGKLEPARIADYGSPIHVLGAAWNLTWHESVVRGRALSAWIRELLEDAPGGGLDPDVTFAELERKTERRLVVVGTDLAHARMVVFPDDLHLYEEHGEELDGSTMPVWRAVRISAGYPFFFPPLRGMRDRHTGKEGVFVDGGVTSAFPLFVFDKKEPAHPTWGFHLHDGTDPNEEHPSYRSIGGPLWWKDMLFGVLAASTGALDKFEDKRFPGRLIAIPTGGISALSFALSPEQQQELYKDGYDATKAFFAADPDGENSYGVPVARVTTRS
jgi:NTE family protein